MRGWQESHSPHAHYRYASYGNRHIEWYFGEWPARDFHDMIPLYPKTYDPDLYFPHRDSVRKKSSRTKIRTKKMAVNTKTYVLLATLNPIFFFSF